MHSIDVEGAEPLVVDFHEHEPPGCQKKTLEIIIIIIIIIITSRTRVIPRTFKGFWKVYYGVAFSKGRPNLASVRLIL